MRTMLPPALVKWPQWLARNITTLQLTQMFANLALLAATFCCCGSNHHISAWPTAAMYTGYACLFLDLFRQKYTNTEDCKVTQSKLACDRQVGPSICYRYQIQCIQTLPGMSNNRS